MIAADPEQLFRSIVALNALFASLAWCLARPNWASMVSTVLFAAIWPLVDKPLGGRILLVLTPTAGLTSGDLLSVLAVVVVAIQAARTANRR